MSLTTDAGAATYAYDPPTGLLTTITAPDGGTLTFDYDAPLLKSQTWGPVESGRVHGTVSYTYDNRFLPKTITVNDDTVERHYDGDGLLTSVTDEHDGPLVFTRDQTTGFVTDVDLGVVHEDHTYNAFGELERHTVTSNGTVVYDVRYFDVADPTNTGRDKLGRITAKTEDVWNPSTSMLERSTTHYTYWPDRNWLETVTTDGTTTTYTYDKNGNRLGRDVGGAPVEEVGDYDEQDRIETYNGTPYTYTADGMLAAKGTGLVATTYDYDALGNLRGVSFPTPADDVGYVIDGLNRRIGKTDDVGELVRGYLWEDDLRVAAELDHESTMLARFVYGTKPNVPEYMIRFNGPAPEATTAYRFVTDHLGSVRLVVDVTTGSIVQRIDYDEFGRIIAHECPALSPADCEQLHAFALAGGQLDVATGLVRFGARDYDPETGRWTSKDPTRFAGGDGNIFSYVSSDPVNFIDPFGLIRIDPKEAFRGGGGGGGYGYGGYGGAGPAGRGCPPAPQGPHSVFRVEPRTGRVLKYETRVPQTNPRNRNPWEMRKRFDAQGDPHFNKVLQKDIPTPHVHDPSTPGGIRPALPDELPGWMR